MFHLEEIGKQMVMEISSLIDQSVIVVDKDGYIIASKDSSRMNTYHEGAIVSMSNFKELHITKELCGKLKGVKEGIVIPIIISNVPIGVIGITGDLEEIEKYAKLVRKVSELFVTEFLMRQQRERMFREIEYFVFDLFMPDSDFKLIEKRAELLNIPLLSYTRAGVIQTSKQLELAEIEELLHAQTLHSELKISRWGLQKLVLLIPKISKPRLRTGLNDLACRLKRMTKHEVSIGIGREKDYQQLPESFRQAEVAAAVCTRERKVIFEEELKIEMLYHSIPEPVRIEYIKRTIAPLLQEQELLHNLTLWLDHSGSLQEMAEALHIHKNTLKYRLNKIESILDIELNNKNDIAMIHAAVGLLRKNQTLSMV